MVVIGVRVHLSACSPSAWCRATLQPCTRFHDLIFVAAMYRLGTLFAEEMGLGDDVFIMFLVLILTWYVSLHAQLHVLIGNHWHTRGGCPFATTVAQIARLRLPCPLRGAAHIGMTNHMLLRVRHHADMLHARFFVHGQVLARACVAASLAFLFVFLLAFLLAFLRSSFRASFRASVSQTPASTLHGSRWYTLACLRAVCMLRSCLARLLTL